MGGGRSEWVGGGGEGIVLDFSALSVRNLLICWLGGNPSPSHSGGRGKKLGRRRSESSRLFKMNSGVRCRSLPSSNDWGGQSFLRTRGSVARSIPCHGGPWLK